MSSYVDFQMIGIPHYFQGEADGLCVYYAMAMILAALHPEFKPTIHDAPKYKRKGSPVFQALRRLSNNDKEFKQKVADWFFDGMKTTDATRLLNNLFQDHYEDWREFFIRRYVRCRRAKRIKYSRKKGSIRRTWTVRNIFDALDKHLPVIVSGGGFGPHAVVLIGYGRLGRGPRWVHYLDPTLVRADWKCVGDVFVGDADAILPNYYLTDIFPRRPMALIVEQDKTRVQAWDQDMSTA
jgi:hypothetical protein